MNASQLIDEKIASYGDWRGELCMQLRQIITQAAPGITEEWKWNTPVWSSNGNVCAIGAFKDHVKINFFQGPQLEDPNKLFNSGFEAKNTRSIDLREGDTIDETALAELVREAVAYNKK